MPGNCGAEARCFRNSTDWFREEPNFSIGLLQQTITWYKIRHTGGQAHYYSRTGTLKQGRSRLTGWGLFALTSSAGIIMSLPSSMADFVPCDRCCKRSIAAASTERLVETRPCLCFSCDAFSFHNERPGWRVDKELNSRNKDKILGVNKKRGWTDIAR